MSIKRSILHFLELIRTWIGKPQKPWSRYLRIVILLTATSTTLVAIFVLLVLAGAFGPLPSRDELRNIDQQVATEVFSADSVLLGKYYLTERSLVPASEIPTTLKQALIATEDVRFYSHGGIDAKSLFRVLIKGMILGQESAGGGSTLTQQLAKNLYPRISYAVLSLPINKVREMIVARRLEAVHSKDEILTLYLNTVPFGDNVYGIGTASSRFYSVPVSQLSLDQSAVLIGMLKATHRYNPRLFPDRAKLRRDVVLSQLHKYKFITAGARDSLAIKPLLLQYQKVSHNAGLAPYFRAHLKSELLAWCKNHKKADGTPYNLYTDGLKIYTTIDSRLQQYAESAMRTHLRQLQKKFVQQLDQKALQKLGTSKVRQLSQYRQMKKEGLEEREILAALRKPGLRQVFSWEGEQEQAISTYDSMIHHLQFLQSGLVAKDPESGAIRAWVGGIDHTYFQYDHVREATKRQVGSTFKPIIYAAALEQGVRPCDYTSAQRTAYRNMDDWTPENEGDGNYDQKYSMEGGLARSVNTVSVKLLERAGIPNAIALAHDLGITSDLPQVPSLALGTASISVMEMVGAYGVFANRGKYVPPAMITSIATSQGATIESFAPQGPPAQSISSETAAMMVHMLRRVTSEGTAASLRTRYGLRNDIAGKTGTTQANADGWFIAITPKLVIGCWVGADDPAIHFKTTAAGQGAATALPIVALLFQQINADADLKDIATARFDALEPHLLAALDCDLSRSDRNLWQRIFNIKKKTKQTRFKGAQKSD